MLRVVYFHFAFKYVANDTSPGIEMREKIRVFNRNITSDVRLETNFLKCHQLASQLIFCFVNHPIGPFPYFFDFDEVVHNLNVTLDVVAVILTLRRSCEFFITVSKLFEILCLCNIDKTLPTMNKQILSRRFIEILCLSTPKTNLTCVPHSSHFC